MESRKPFNDREEIGKKTRRIKNEITELITNIRKMKDARPSSKDERSVK